MTQKKKAELQRKLSMSAVPTPPADLARRIKADIPDPLITMKAERERFSSSIAFSMRVAASIVLLLTSVVLSFHLVSRGEGPFQQEKAATRTPPPAAAPESKSVVPQFADTATITVTVAEEADAASAGSLAKEESQRLQATANVETSPALRQSRRDAPQQVARVAPVSAGASIGGTAGYVGGRVAEGERSRDMVLQRPVATAPAAAPPPPPAVEPPAIAEDAARAESITVTAQAPVSAPALSEAATITPPPQVVETRRSAKASKIADARFNDEPRTVFGLSVDPDEFSRIKSMIERGQKPADRVDVEALVNHFAGTTAPLARAVRLQVEGSRLPIARNESVTMLRFTVDTASADRSSAPVGSDAKIEVILNRNVLLRHRVVGDTGELEASEGVLRRGLSVTGLVELRLKPDLRPRQEIATVRLTYRSAADGRTKTETISVTARDLDKSWTAASRRHRLATLGAVWGESLRVESEAEDVARAAEGLADESPGDTRARDLAAAATASSRLRSSAPTGSGR